jgi:hypothetical protein
VSAAIELADEGGIESLQHAQAQPGARRLQRCRSTTTCPTRTTFLTA